MPWIYYNSDSDGITYTWEWGRPLSATEIAANEECCPQNDNLMQQMYEEYMALQQAEKELEEDKKKYPLFFLKEGIV